MLVSLPAGNDGTAWQGGQTPLVEIVIELVYNLVAIDLNLQHSLKGIVLVDNF